jgi:signal transduction histidine kinase
LQIIAWDNGKGISKEHLGKIYDPFSPLKSAEKALA